MHVWRQVIMFNHEATLQALAMGQVKHVHFVGIGGAGMGGIAEVLFHQGYNISGSDLCSNTMTQRLGRLGIRVFRGHHQSHIEHADVVVRSSAVDDENIEIISAHAAHIPVISRAQMLAELMRFNYGIAVAGSHGKTTTTSLIASVLADVGLDPTFIIGGQLNQLGSHAYLGDSRYLIAEADESDASFLYLHPMIAVVTNLDADHLQTYQGDFTVMRRAFLDFLHHLPFYGRAIISADDPHLVDLIPEINRPLTTFGFSDSADVQALNYQQKAGTALFDVCYQKQTLPVVLNLPGPHNVQNALASLSVALSVNIPLVKAIDVLSRFSGIVRRFDVHGPVTLAGKTVEIIDDYGHHPSEIKATLNAIRAGWPGKRILMVYQPHRYTRTRDLFDAFVETLSLADDLILLEVYSAGEPEIAGADGQTLSDAIKKKGKISPIFVKDIDSAVRIVMESVQSGDLLLTQGAGNISEVAKKLVAQNEAVV